MSSTLDKYQVEDLLIYCGTSPTIWKDSDMLVCCPVHHESNPSMGVNVEKQVCHCFSCGFAGGFHKLLYSALPDEFRYDPTSDETQRQTWYKAERKARQFLKERYELEYREIGETTKLVKRYDDFITIKEPEKDTIPLYKIAPYMSGKETYSYFFERGFDKEDVITYKIGRDLKNKTVTLPVFNADNELQGVIGRYISKYRKHNQRYKIYDSFKRGNTLYPLNHYKPMDSTIIIVEGILDAIKMHKHGYTNTLSIMTNEMTIKQARIISNMCTTVIYLGDNDKRGYTGMLKNKNLLSRNVNFKIVDYPDYGKDPCDWNKEDIDIMINNSHSYLMSTIKRY